MAMSSIVQYNDWLEEEVRTNLGKVYVRGKNANRVQRKMARDLPGSGSLTYLK